MNELQKTYLKSIAETTTRGDAREESYYSFLKTLVENAAGNKRVAVTVLPKKTDAGNPDFRVWDGKQHITGYIEAKTPGANLDQIENSEQLQRYRETFPNLILTDFYEFRLYRDGQRIAKTFAVRYVQIVTALAKTLAIQKEIDEVYPQVEKELIAF